jgi:hypothetical protein
MLGRESFGEDTSDGVGGGVDAEERRQSDGQVDRLS